MFLTRKTVFDYIIRYNMLIEGIWHKYMCNSRGCTAPEGERIYFNHISTSVGIQVFSGATPSVILLDIYMNHSVVLLISTMK